MSGAKLDVLLGLQWGDEGKGKIVDVLAKDYRVVARFQGGPNAGHSLEFDDRKFVLHSIPSGIFNPETVNIIGSGVVLDPTIFREEVEELERAGVKDLKKRLCISRKTHLILPSHRALDAASEAAKGAGKIGSTLRGIGPCYMDKTGRNGLRVGDVELPDFMERYNRLRAKHEGILAQHAGDYPFAQWEDAWFRGIEKIREFTLVDSEAEVNGQLNQGISVLAEGAQGSMLDIDFGSYPFVTSSNTLCSGACSGLGIAPGRVGRVYGICKAYCTRVGAGPFPSELHDETGEKLRQLGHEFGATTGRERRCGWLDLVALRYAIMLNGVTDLILTKADVLSGFDTIRVVRAYRVDGVESETLPYTLEQDFEMVYDELPGWSEDLTGMTEYALLPQALRDYVSYLEEKTGVRVTIVSVGPDRKQTIARYPIGPDGSR